MFPILADFLATLRGGGIEGAGQVGTGEGRPMAGRAGTGADSCAM